MTNNTYSLLSDNWMFADNSKSILYPYLFQLINGKNVLIQNTLPPTTHFFQSSTGMQSTANTEVQSSSVAVIKMHHPIFKYDQECGPRGTQSIMGLMEAWKEDSNIAGVVLDVNSGGGQASGNAEFAEYINSYPKPVEVFTKDVIGSAAYYFSAAANKITAHKFADFVGCIGSMYHSVNLEGVIKQKGGAINEFYADLSPEKNLQSRELKKGNERPLIEKLLNPSAEQFHLDMKKYRPQLTEKALKGDIFSPEEALKEGLIDELGTLQSVIQSVFNASKNHKPNNTNNLNNSNQSRMSKLNVPLIEAAIGSTFSSGETENGIILNDEQAKAIENILQENATENTALKSEVETVTATVATLTQKQTEVSAAITAALTTAEVENAASLSEADGIVALSNLVAEYGAKDGAAPTKTKGDGTDVDDVNPNIVSGVDISAAMNC